MKLRFKYFILFLAIPTISWAQLDTTDSNFSETKALLQKIKEDNFFRTGSLHLRTGLVSLSSNLGDPLKLNSKNQMFFLTAEGDFEIGRISRGFGVNLETTIAQNLLGGMPSSSSNSASSQILFYQFGPRHRWILDESNIKDYFQIKLLYHSMSNTFKMNSLDSTALSFPKSHTGFLLGFERNIPATSKYDFKASFDLFYLVDTKEIDSVNDIDKKGRGIQMKGEAFYNLKKNSRFGILYSLSHFVNKFSNQSDGDTGKSSSTHTYRYMGIGYSYLF